jgi:hypothetical protein
MGWDEDDRVVSLRYQATDGSEASFGFLAIVILPDAATGGVG